MKTIAKTLLLILAFTGIAYYARGKITGSGGASDTSIAAAEAAALVAPYGLGTALPVGIIAVLLILSSEKAGLALDGVRSFQKIAMTLTAVILIGVGVWLTLQDTLA